MKFTVRITAVWLSILVGSVSVASATENQKDQKALDLLNRMAAYTDTLDSLVIKGESFADARLDAGLIVSNSSEIVLKIDRPGSLYVQSFDGVNTREIYIHESMLTLYSSERGFYSRAKVPERIEEAMQFALDNYDLELPLAELFFADSVAALLSEQDTVLYLTDKSRIGGVDCHHIAVRGDEIDLQLWITEGDKPVARKISMTMKWEGGSPRSIALMDYTGVDGFDSKVFEFTPPEGTQEIRFYGSE